MALFPPGCIGSYAVLWPILTRRQPVQGDAPPRYPLLVLTGEKASVVTASELPAFLAEHTDATLLVPAEMEPRIAGQFPDWDSMSLEVGRDTPGVQQIHLDASRYDDQHDESWYEARARSFTPKYVKFYSGFARGMLAMVSMPLGLVIACVAAFLIIRRRERAEPKAA